MLIKHKTFISYYHKDDNVWRERFEVLFRDIIINKSVGLGEIASDNSAEYIRHLIQQNYLSDSTVMIVLIGPNTWGRKHVDWEIYGALDHRVGDKYAGLIGILLPTHPDFYSNCYNEAIVPARLADNQKSGYAKIHNWTEDVSLMKKYIDQAMWDRANNHLINNRRLQMQRNRSGV